ncbi:MAG: cytidylate kinase, putative [uncultured archaeon A07HB70]|jgi:cytidylate kinase, putative|nr:MAG: cytidylate kinase, putative [uncultured archaeon A07HB70]
MLITVSGPAGGGKSTLAAALAEALDYEHVSGGDIFRAVADERGLSPVELNELAETEPAIDYDLDRRQYDLARSRDDLVLESRLAGWLAGDTADIRVWLTAPLAVRVERIADREEKPAAAVSEETRRRAESEARRYRTYYDIDIDDLSIYDLVLNTARWEPDAATAVVRTAVESYTDGGDEGAMPVEGVRYEFQRADAE